MSVAEGGVHQVEVCHGIDHDRHRCAGRLVRGQPAQRLVVGGRIGDHDVGGRALLDVPDGLGEGVAHEAFDPRAREHALQQVPAADRLADHPDRLPGRTSPQVIGVRVVGGQVDHGERRIEVLRREVVARSGGHRSKVRHEGLKREYYSLTVPDISTDGQVRMTRWTNWAGTASATPQYVHQPRSTAEIAETVSAVANAGRRLRAQGSRHSFAAIAAADSDALDLRHWAGIVQADIESGRVTVRSGTTLKRLNAELGTLGLAMTNLGDIDAQTVAGAISTGTHGTGARFGGIATQIAALELVLADGSIVNCSADERPDLFAAAKVGLGALGVISTVTLQCEPAFALQAVERPEPLEQVLEGFHDFAAENDHFEFYWFPYGRN